MRTNKFDKALLKASDERNAAFKINFRSKGNIIINLIVTFGFMTLATLLSFAFRYIEFHESNIIIAYILGVLFVAKQTDTYFYGILASAIGVMTFNFFFTEPYFTFAVYRADYPVTFIIMLIAAIITSTMTAKIKREATLSSLREERTHMLYEINKNLLKASTINDIADITSNSIAKMFNGSVVIILNNISRHFEKPLIYYSDIVGRDNIFHTISDEKNDILQLFDSDNSAGGTIDFFKDNYAYYLPIQGQSHRLGIIAVSYNNKMELSTDQKTIFKAVALQFAITIEKELLSEQQQKSKLDMEREKLRGNLLRAISHDLRTPLTGILGATATIIENETVIDNKVKRELLQDIYEQTSWLIHSVENILNMTRIEEGQIDIKKKMEAVEEIVASAVSRVKKVSPNHKFKVNMPEILIMIPIEGTLIEQVIINLLDNAIKYTPYGSTIEINVCKEEDKIVFEVSDNGRGIPQAVIPHIFDRFYTSSENVNIRKRGIGLGLAICKSIINLHNGEIYAYNNASGGATFKFILPAKE
jgi:two-component system, OmpR family, sensor histidine kinase KdpD